MTDYQQAARDFRRYLDAACERQLGFGGMGMIERCEQVKAGIAAQYGLSEAEMTAVLAADDDGLLWLDESGEMLDGYFMSLPIRAEVLG
jgi:ribonuclease HI